MDVCERWDEGRFDTNRVEEGAEKIYILNIIVLCPCLMSFRWKG